MRDIEQITELYESFRAGLGMEEEDEIQVEFFFSSRRRHTRSVSAFLLNRSSDLRDYFRDIGRMVLAAEGRKANDSHADCYQYFCVPEYGTANGRLHFHAVHFMRTLPTGSVDPNFGRRVRNRRQLIACKIRGLMVTVCPSQFATRRTLFHVLVGCGLLMLKVSRLKLPVIWLLVSMWLNTLTKSQIWTLLLKV